MLHLDVLKKFNIPLHQLYLMIYEAKKWKRREKEALASNNKTLKNTENISQGKDRTFITS
jgi:hypothetical protein